MTGGLTIAVLDNNSVHSWPNFSASSIASDPVATRCAPGSSSYNLFTKEVQCRPRSCMTISGEALAVSWEEVDLAEGTVEMGDEPRVPEDGGHRDSPGRAYRPADRRPARALKNFDDTGQLPGATFGRSGGGRCGSIEPIMRRGGTATSGCPVRKRYRDLGGQQLIGVLTWCCAPPAGLEPATLRVTLMACECLRSPAHCGGNLGEVVRPAPGRVVAVVVVVGGG